VGIVTRDRARLLPKALASALAQRGIDVRIAVLDDGSQDDTPSLRPRFPDVGWARQDPPRGIIASRNHLMRTAAADLYVSLDDDAWFWAGDEIAVATARMAARPRLAAIAFDILSPDRPAPRQRAEPVPATIFIGCGHLLRLAAVHAVGGYADVPGTYGAEEKDLSLRLLDAGWTIEKLPGVHVWHEKAWAGRDWYPLHRSGVCNELVMTLRRCPMPDVFAVLPLKLVSFTWFWLRRPRYFRAGMAGVTDFLRHSPGSWRTRAPVRRRTFWRATRGRAP